MVGSQKQSGEKEGMVGVREDGERREGDEEGKSTIIKIMDIYVLDHGSGASTQAQETKYDSDIPVPWVSPVSQDPLCIQPGLNHRDIGFPSFRQLHFLLPLNRFIPSLKPHDVSE